VQQRLLVKVKSNIGRCGMESGTSKARENRNRAKGSLNEPIYCTDVARTEARLARGRSDICHVEQRAFRVLTSAEDG